MGKINVKIAQAHKNQMRNFDVQREMKSVQNYFDTTELDFNSEAVSLMFLRGGWLYVQFHFHRRKTSEM